MGFNSGFKGLMKIQGVGYDIGLHIQFRVTDDRRQGISEE
jgi:hypothetical protein